MPSRVRKEVLSPVETELRNDRTGDTWERPRNTTVTGGRHFGHRSSFVPLTLPNYGPTPQVYKGQSSFALRDSGVEVGGGVGGVGRRKEVGVGGETGESASRVFARVGEITFVRRPVGHRPREERDKGVGRTFHLVHVDTGEPPKGYRGRKGTVKQGREKLKPGLL